MDEHDGPPPLQLVEQRGEARVPEVAAASVAEVNAREGEQLSPDSGDLRSDTGSTG
jgi:hypothetical protein